MVIIDCCNLFSNCNNIIDSHRVILITNVEPKEVMKGERSYKAFKNRPLVNMIVLQDVKLEKKIYYFRFWQVKDNRTFDFYVVLLI